MANDWMERRIALCDDDHLMNDEEQGLHIWKAGRLLVLAVRIWVSAGFIRLGSHAQEDSEYEAIHNL